MVYGINNVSLCSSENNLDIGGGERKGQSGDQWTITVEEQFWDSSTAAFIVGALHTFRLISDFLPIQYDI